MLFVSMKLKQANSIESHKLNEIHLKGTGNYKLLTQYNFIKFRAKISKYRKQQFLIIYLPDRSVSFGILRYLALSKSKG